MSWLLVHSYPRRQNPSTKSSHTEVRGTCGSLEGWSFAARIVVLFAMMRGAGIPLGQYEQHDFSWVWSRMLTYCRLVWGNPADSLELIYSFLKSKLVFVGRHPVKTAQLTSNSPRNTSVEKVSDVRMTACWLRKNGGRLYQSKRLVT